MRERAPVSLAAALLEPMRLSMMRPRELSRSATSRARTRGLRDLAHSVTPHVPRHPSTRTPQPEVDDPIDPVPVLAHFGGQGFPYLSHLHQTLSRATRSAEEGADGDGTFPAAPARVSAVEATRATLAALRAERDCVDTNDLEKHLPIDFDRLTSIDEIIARIDRPVESNGGVSLRVRVPATRRANPTTSTRPLRGRVAAGRRPLAISSSRRGLLERPLRVRRRP